MQYGGRKLVLTTGMAPFLTNTKMSVDYGKGSIWIQCCRLTPRRPIRKVTPKRPIGRIRPFRWKRYQRLLKLSPTFSQVLKSIIWLFNTIFISEKGRNWLISSEIFSQENTFMVPLRPSPHDSSMTKDSLQYHFL